MLFSSINLEIALYNLIQKFADRELLKETEKEIGHQKAITSLSKSSDWSHFITGSLDKSTKVLFFWPCNCVSSATAECWRLLRHMSQNAQSMHVTFRLFFIMYVFNQLFLFGFCCLCMRLIWWFYRVFGVSTKKKKSYLRCIVCCVLATRQIWIFI